MSIFVFDKFELEEKRRAECVDASSKTENTKIIVYDLEVGALTTLIRLSDLAFNTLIQI